MPAKPRSEVFDPERRQGLSLRESTRASTPDDDEYRRRLSDTSWMMRLACQPIAPRTNK